MFSRDVKRIETHSTNRKMKLTFLFSLFASLMLGSLLAHAAPDRTRPNFILIMVDDMGYSDIGCYGGEVKTPNLDQLAKNGMRFTQFYNTAKCHTTRAELLTGNYAYSIGDNNMEHGATFGEVLRPIGYRTLIAGKWHQKLCPRPVASTATTGWPTAAAISSTQGSRPAPARDLRAEKARPASAAGPSRTR